MLHEVPPGNAVNFLSPVEVLCELVTETSSKHRTVVFRLSFLRLGFFLFWFRPKAHIYTCGSVETLRCRVKGEPSRDLIELLGLVWMLKGAGKGIIELIGVWLAGRGCMVGLIGKR